MIQEQAALLSEFHQSPPALIQERYSVRTYRREPIPSQQLQELEQFFSHLPPGPFGTSPRFQLAAAREGDSEELKGLGTYGFIRHPQGFVIGAGSSGEGELEDFGYLMEVVILKAVDLGLGSCWLGGTFTRSRFARAIQLRKDEIIPSVVALGLPADQPGMVSRAARAAARADRRRPWEELFFEDTERRPLTSRSAGPYQEPLEMVRIGPSASNKQPWRILKSGEQWHFYLARTPNYLPRLPRKLLQIPDLQRIDLGIAMSHFSLSCASAGLPGTWTRLDAAPEIADWDYTSTFQARSGSS